VALPSLHRPSSLQTCSFLPADRSISPDHKHSKQSALTRPFSLPLAPRLPRRNLTSILICLAVNASLKNPFAAFMLSVTLGNPFGHSLDLPFEPRNLSAFEVL
jgi:hypothetical protein